MGVMKAKAPMKSMKVMKIGKKFLSSQKNMAKAKKASLNKTTLINCNKPKINNKGPIKRRNAYLTALLAGWSCHDSTFLVQP